jgi:putative hemolysin
VGEFADEGDESPEIVVLEDGTLSVDGRIPLTALAAHPGAPSIEASPDYETLAGFVLHRLGRIPVVGDAFVADGYRYEVTDMDARRVDRVTVREHSD